MDVVHKVIICHLHVANSHCQTQHLLHLEPDRGVHFISVGHHVLMEGQQGRELAGLTQPGPRMCGICLVRDSEAKKASYVLAGFLASFLFLPSFFSTSLTMWGISTAWASSQCCWSPRTHTENWGAGSGFKPAGAGEAFVLLRVIVLQADLQPHRLQNLPAHALVSVQDFLPHHGEDVAGDVAARVAFLALHKLGKSKDDS